MLNPDYTAWDECPEADKCEMLYEFMELVNDMITDIQHLKAEAIRARYELSKVLDPESEWITTVDLLSNLDMPHYDSKAYQEFILRYYDGGDPLAFKEFIDSMVSIAKGNDDRKY